MKRVYLFAEGNKSQPVYKYEADEYGFIHKNTTTTRNHSFYYIESLLPSSYRNKPATAHGGMSTQGDINMILLCI